MEPARRPYRLSRRRFLSMSAAAAAASAVPLPRALAGAGCHPTRTAPEYRGVVPTPEEVLGLQVGVDREVTVAEAYAYFDAVNKASDRVRVRTLGHSQLGRPIMYAVVGRPGHVGPDGLEAVRRAHETIRDPRTPRARAATLAEATPAFLWVGANIHGNEESGTDACVRLLHELADRRDCVVDRILNNAVVVIVPIQNPDGRERDIRRNTYGFDLNRDYLSRTQPETDGKVELMRRYPPLLFLDHHEFGYYRSFFPPNDDPVYHEVTEEVEHWINDVYGPALGREFNRRTWDFFHRGQGYDFFAPIFTDTATSFGFQGVGMTIEVYNGREVHARYARQLAVMWIGLWEAATHKNRILRGWHAAFVKAVEEGRRGTLQPNRVYERENEVLQPVPRVRVRNYWVVDEHPARRRETRLLIRKLQRMDVRVYRLDAPLEVPDYRPHWERPRARRLPAGTYWIPMGQPQKHWIQAAMNEDAYVPIDEAYGLTGFSLALESGADVGWSGSNVSPAAHMAAPVPDPGPPPHDTVPRIKVWQTSGNFYAWESTGWLRHLLDNVWQLPYEHIRSEDVRQGALGDCEVLIVPSGGINYALKKMGRKGQRAVVDWVNGGGHYVGYRYAGAMLPGVLGLTDVKLGYRPALRDILLRVQLDKHSPLGAGLGEFIWIAHDGDYLIRDSLRRTVVAQFPTRDSGDFAVNGFTGGTRYLLGRAVITDQRVGEGRIITSSHDLNYRAETIGAQRVLWNAIFGRDPAGPADRPAVYDPVAVDRRAASLPDDGLPSAIIVSVPETETAEARRILSSFGASIRRLSAEEGDATFAVANPEELTLEEHPFAGLIPDALRSRGVRVTAFRAPS